MPIIGGKYVSPNKKRTKSFDEGTSTLLTPTKAAETQTTSTGGMSTLLTPTKAATTIKRGGGSNLPMSTLSTPTTGAVPIKDGFDFSGKVEVIGKGGEVEETKYYKEGKKVGGIYKTKGGEFVAEKEKGVKSTMFQFDTEGGTKREVVELGGSTGGARITEYEMIIGGSSSQEFDIVGGGDIDLVGGFNTSKVYGGTRTDMGDIFKMDIPLYSPGTIYSYQTGEYKGTPLTETRVVQPIGESRLATREEQLLVNPMTVEARGGFIGQINEKGEYIKMSSGEVSSPLDWKGVTGETGVKVKNMFSQELPTFTKVEEKIINWEGKEGDIFTKVDRQFLGGIATGIIPSTKGELALMGGTVALGFATGGISTSFKIGVGAASKIIGGGMVGAYGISTGIKMSLEPDIAAKGEVLGMSARDFGLFTGGFRLGYKTFIPKTEIISLRETKIPAFKEERYNVIANGKLYRVGKYEINVEKQPPRIKYTSTEFRELFNMKPLEVKYLPKVTSKVKTPFRVINEEPFTILEQKPMGKIGKVGMVEGVSKEFKLQTDIYGASNVEKYLVKGLYKYKTGVPAPSSEKELVSFFNKNKIRFMSDIQTTKSFKMDIGKKPIEVNLEPIGKRTSRFVALTEITPIKETEVFSLSRSNIVFKDVTYPFARASGRTPQMKGVTLEWNEPIILSSGKDVTFIRTSGGKRTPLSNTFLKKIQEQKYVLIPKPIIKTASAKIVTQELQTPELISQVVSPSLNNVQKGFSQEDLVRTRFIEKDIPTNIFSNEFISVNLHKNAGKEVNKNISKEINKNMNINIEKNINKEMTKEISKNIQKEMQKQIQKNTLRSTFRDFGWGFTTRGFFKPPIFFIPRGKLNEFSGMKTFERGFKWTPSLGAVLGKEFGISFERMEFGEVTGLFERPFKTGIKLPTII